MNMRVGHNNQFPQEQSKIINNEKAGVMANGSSVKRQSGNSFINFLKNLFFGRKNLEEGSKKEFQASLSVPKEQTSEKATSTWQKAKERPTSENRQKAYNDGALRNSRGLMNEMPTRPSTPAPIFGKRQQQLKMPDAPSRPPSRPLTPNPFVKQESELKQESTVPTMPPMPKSEPKQESIASSPPPPPPIPIPKGGIPNVKPQENSDVKENDKSVEKEIKESPIGREKVSSEALKMGFKNLKKATINQKEKTSDNNHNMKFNESLLNKVGDTSVENSEENADEWDLPEDKPMIKPAESSKVSKKTIETSEEKKTESKQISDEDRAKLEEQQRNVRDNLASDLERLRRRSGQTENEVDDEW